MPYGALAAREVANVLKAVAHPARIRVIEELRSGERDVNSLQMLLQTTHSGVSQHLMVLRAYRLVAERREGRHVFYRLRKPEIADWLAEAVDLLLETAEEVKQMQAAIRKSRAAWRSTKRSEKRSNGRSK